MRTRSSELPSASEKNRVSSRTGNSTMGVPVFGESTVCSAGALAKSGIAGFGVGILFRDHILRMNRNPHRTLQRDERLVRRISSPLDVVDHRQRSGRGSI